MREIRHLGKRLSKTQIAALAFALAEGCVGRGCDPTRRGVRITSATIRYLMGAGLATSENVYQDPKTGRWVKLTAWGKEVAAKTWGES